MNPALADLILDDAKIIADKINFSEIKGKSILITGASGLIGHYLVATLAATTAKGNRPSAIFLVVKNELPTYFEKLTAGLPVIILKGDLAEDISLPTADYIVHGAGYGQPGKFTLDPVKTLKLNTFTTFRLLDKLNPNGKFLFLSSSEVYSGLTTPPHREDQIGTTNTNHPRACYIEGKRGGEVIVNIYRQRGVNAKSARASLVYGPGTRTDDARVLNNFIKKAIVDKQITLLDHGLAHRTYMYVTDAVELLFNMLFFGKQDIYNLGGASRITIGDLAKNVGAILRVPVKFPDTDQGMQGAPDDVMLDMTRANTEFHKTHLVSLDEGLKKTITWQKELYSPNS